MNEKNTEKRVQTTEFIISFAICFVIGFLYVQNAIALFSGFHLLGVGVLALLSTAFGGQISETRKQSIYLYSILIFVVCLAGFHFFLYLPNS
tara:strand:+ start:244 stop:519 length:276 start_codon:yes stop_codon:yes gene_type:complete